ncbi:MAG: tRNA (5-methylaminomethyl-2-thiouridine)(34)-methyltransferase MnmD [Chitinophagales bacterium]
MDKKIIITGDGSHSISIPEMNVTYHSIHGAIRESKHVFIEAGLKSVRPLQAARRLSIFEMGFGTGLNALLTFIEAEKPGRTIYYETIELSPLSDEQFKSLNYCEQLQRRDVQTIFEKLHDCDWEKEIVITENFTFKKSKINLVNFETVELFQLIYFDAFDPIVQPELWTEKIFEKMFSILEPGGILVTYSSKGDVRRAMQAAGFIVEKLPGPPGKREIIRAAHPKFT